MWTQAEKADDPVKTEAEIRSVLPKTKECLGLPEAERGKEESSPRVLQGDMALPTP